MIRKDLTDRFSEAVTAAEQRIENALTPITDRTTLTTRARVKRAVIAAYVSIVVLANPVSAQFEEVGEALCDSGLGEIIAYGIALFSIVLLIKFIFMVMSALDKYDSPKPQEHEEGVDLMKSSAFTLMAALSPVLLGFLFEVVGIATFSCLELDIGILT